MTATSLALRIGAHIEPRDPFWVQVREAVYQRAEQVGVALVWLDADPMLFDEPTAHVVVDMRHQQLDALIAVYIAEPLVDELLAAGIPLVHLSESDTRAPQLVTPTGLYESALTAMTFLSAQIGGSGHVLVVGGLYDAGEGGRSRLAAIQHVACNYPSLTVSHIPCLWSPQLAQPQIVAALERLAAPIDAILGLSDSLAMLVRDLAYARGLTQATTPVVGINGDPLALAAIAAGTMTATVETPAAEFGRQAVDYACLLARGEPLPVPFGYLPRLVTAQNVAEVAVRKLIALAELPSRLVGVNREQEQRRMAQLEISLAINWRVGGLMNRRELSHLIANLIRTNYRSHSVQLLLWHPTTRLLLRDLPGPSDLPQQIVPSGALATALRDNHAVFIPDLRHSDGEPCAPMIRSRVVVPIRVGETILGLLDMQHDQPIQLSRQELAGLQSLADQLGVAMQNAELYEAALHARAVAEQANQLKTRLLANVSHELRTPLNVILGYSEGLLLPPGGAASTLPAEALHDIRHIYQSGEHLIQLINDLLDLSRADIGELDLFPVRLDPVPFLRDLFQSVAGSAPHSPACAGPSTCPLRCRRWTPIPSGCGRLSSICCKTPSAIRRAARLPLEPRPPQTACISGWRTLASVFQPSFSSRSSSPSPAASSAGHAPTGSVSGGQSPAAWLHSTPGTLLLKVSRNAAAPSMFACPGLAPLPLRPAPHSQCCCGSLPSRRPDWRPCALRCRCRCTARA
ncbi:substrate-binding domain-containing protein, partial [Candidatus Gracilibacteria bacterium]|nr:substrate-binding domain-containing protein [Candidatus Gracilibacteria bacterium]